MRISRYYFDLDCKTAILSDIHDKAFDLSILVKENVDLILIPGDICSEHLSEKAWEQTYRAERSIQWKCPNVVLNLFQKLPKIAPTFYSLGNHESRWNEIDKQVVRDSGTVLLDNEYCRFNDILIGGISSPSRHGTSKHNVELSVKELIEKMKKEEGKKILLLHEPQLYDKYGLQDQVIDLVVSGHAHGGQWRFFGHGVFAPGQGILPKYTKGFYNGNLLVSAGMTNTAPVPRLFNPTEIVIVE